MKRRVVITGMGAVTPLGNDVNAMWEGIKNGKNGIDFIKSFDASNLKVQIAGEVKDLDPSQYLEPNEYRKTDPVIMYGLIAATEAYKNAKLDGAEINHDRFGTFVTSGIGGLTTIISEARKADEKGGDRVSPFFIPNSIINLVGGNIAIKFKAKAALHYQLLLLVPQVQIQLVKHLDIFAIIILILLLLVVLKQQLMN